MNNQTDSHANMYYRQLAHCPPPSAFSKSPPISIQFYPLRLSSPASSRGIVLCRAGAARRLSAGRHCNAPARAARLPAGAARLLRHDAHRAYSGALLQGHGRHRQHVAHATGRHDLVRVRGEVAGLLGRAAFSGGEGWTEGATGNRAQRWNQEAFFPSLTVFLNVSNFA